MLKNITLSTNERLIVKARKKAQSSIASAIDKEYSNLMDQLSYAKPSGRYSRDEMNER